MTTPDRIVIVCMQCFRSWIAPAWWTDGMASAQACPSCKALRLRTVHTDQPITTATALDWPAVAPKKEDAPNASADQ